MTRPRDTPSSVSARQPDVSRARAAAAAGTICLVAAVSLWPALVNGGPFFMPDTPSYLRASASGFYKFLGWHSDWTQEYLRVYAPAGPSPALAAGSAPPSAGGLPVTLSGRSPYYGALLSISDFLGTLWIAIVAQSLIAATAIVLTLNGLTAAMGRRSGAAPLLIGVALALTTSLSFFISYLMPDLFGGLAILATANLLFLARDEGPAARLFWVVLLLFSLVAHSANAAIVLTMTAVGALFLVMHRLPLPRAMLATILSCLAAAFLAQLAFASVVRASTGASPVRPPFLAMRLIADGPGYAFLQTHCGSGGFLYCRVLRSGQRPSDELLWSANPDVSLFRGLPPNEQRVSAAQQNGFVKQVILSRPLEVVETGLANALGQLANFRLDGFNYSGGMIQRFNDSVPPRTMRAIESTRAYRGAMPTAFFEISSVVLALASLLVLLVLLFPRAHAPIAERVRGLCLAVIAGVAINAVVCGAMSGPKGRYQMRLIWVLPLIAAGVAAGPRRSRGQSRAQRLQPDMP